jgi:hypothetical protein
MITDSETALEEFLNLRNFGRVIVRTNSPSFLLRWSDDGETIFYGNEFSITISCFHILAEHFLSKAEVLCKDFLFGLDPAIDLT